MLDIEDAITSTLEHLDFVVESFDKATGVSMNKEIGDLFKPVFQGLDESIKTGQITSLNASDPGP